MTPVAERTVRLERPLDLRLTLGPLRHGRRDPCVRLADRELWRATRTPDGPATMRLRVDPAGAAVRARAWGPGRDWVTESLPDLLGEHDDDRALADLLRRAPAAGADGAGHRRLAALHHRLAGLRIPRTASVIEALVPAILEQKVTGLEAKRSYRELVHALGEPAPGPGADQGLLLPPRPAVLATTPSWTFHRCGVERKRADAITTACSYAPQVEASASLPPAEARRRLGALPGIGPWTTAEVALVALGDADAVSVGDYHLPDQVAWALTGRARGDDRRMLELLEPYRGQRGRVIRLIVAGGLTAPRFGPRLEVRSFRHR